MAIFKTTKEEIDLVFEKQNQFTIEAPYNHAFNISVNSNVTILNRIYNSHEIKNDYFPFFKQRLWSSSENKLISDMLLVGNEPLIYMALKWIPFEVLQRKVYYEKEKLFHRPLERKEYLLIQEYNEHKISFEQLLISCKCRTKESLEFIIKKM